MSLQKTDYALFGMIAFFTLLRLLVAPSFGLGVDEAHYALYAKYLDLSYVDHPPLVGWAHVPLYRLFGTSEFMVRLPAILLFAAASLLCYRFAREISGSKVSAFTAVLAVNGSFLLNAMGLMLLPDCFLLVLVFPLIEVILRIEKTGRFKYYVALGLLLGTAGLAKYTAIFFVLPLVIYFIMKKRYDRLFSPYMVPAALVALAMVTPVIYWNYQHDFISFRYQGGHILGASSPSLASLLLSLLAQLGAYSPPLFAVAFYGFARSFKSKDDRIRLALLFGGTLFAFFLYSSLYERTLPHWTSVFYMLFIAVGVHYLLLRPRRKFLYFSMGVSLVLTLFLYAELYSKWFAFPDYKSPFRDIYGFADIAAEANAILKEDKNPRKAIAVTNWTMGSRMMYYGLPYGMKVFVMDQRSDQFDIWEKERPEGYDLLFVNTWFHRQNIGKRFICGSSEKAKSIDITLNGAKVDSIDYVWCRNYRGINR